MPRGKAEFKTMTPIKTDGKDCTVPKGQDVKINEQPPSRSDPMKNLMSKGGESCKKGLKSYNDMVEKGSVADIEMNPHNVGEAMGKISERADIVEKGVRSLIGKVRRFAKDMKDPELRKLAKNQLYEQRGKFGLSAGLGVGAGAAEVQRRIDQKELDRVKSEQKGFIKDIELNSHNVGEAVKKISERADVVEKGFSEFGREGVKIVENVGKKVAKRESTPLISQLGDIRNMSFEQLKAQNADNIRRMKSTKVEKGLARNIGATVAKHRGKIGLGASVVVGGVAGHKIGRKRGRGEGWDAGAFHGQDIAVESINNQQPKGHEYDYDTIINLPESDRLDKRKEAYMSGKRIPINELGNDGPPTTMAHPDQLRKKGFIKDIIDEARVSIENKEHNMRGNANFPVMKGFGMTTKGDTAAEEQLNDKMASKKDAPKGKIRDKSDDLTFDPELQLVEDGAKRDVMDGYVADHMREKPATKGFEAYNEMVAKGIAADVTINPHNVGESMGIIAKNAEAVFKETSEGITTKGAKKATEDKSCNTPLETKGAVTEGLKKIGSGIKEGITAGGKKVLEGGKSVLEGTGQSVENAVRSRGSSKMASGWTPGTKPPTETRIANAIGRNRKAVGAATIGVGAAGVGGAAYGAKKVTEDKED